MLKPIINYDGYFISDSGIVYSNLGKGNRRNGKTIDLYILMPRFAKNGYARVFLRNSITNKRKDLYIHRLVAEAFIPNPDGLKYVNHKDCDRSNNCVNNLEWCTAKYNIEYAIKMKHMYRDEETGRYQSYLKQDIV